MEILNKIRSIKLLLMTHPDNTKDSEFADKILDLEHIEEELLKIKYHNMKQKQIDLTQKSFTDEFKNNTLLLDVEFNKLKAKIDRSMIYVNGQIGGVVVCLINHNKEILSKFIKDFKSYNELIDFEFCSAKKENQTDLISIIDYHENKHSKELLYDVENDFFYYEVSE